MVLNCAFIIGQRALYDMVTMTSDITDPSEADCMTGKVAMGQCAFGWSAEQLQSVAEFRCLCVEVQRGMVTLRASRLVSGSPGVAFGLASTPRADTCLGGVSLWPGAVCCYLVELGAGYAEGEKPVMPGVDLVGVATGDGAVRRWWRICAKEY